MIGRKLLILQGGQVFHNEEAIFKTPYLEEWKHLTVKSIRRYGYAGLVATIRLYVRTSGFLNNTYQKIKTKIKERGRKSINSDRKEISKFLRVISEYKHKIREIKHRIKEEENL
ncbi:MAG: hypothetical protein WCP17_01875 [bacterium]